MEFEIGRVKFTNSKTVIIAEAGVNHLGRMDYAEKLISGAASAGVDIVKFQTYKASKLTTKNAPRFWNWNGEVETGGSQFASYSMLDSFGVEEYKKLKSMCDYYEVEFLSTPFDLEAVEMLYQIGVGGFKIASCDINNFPLLESIASKNLPILLSTGASNIQEIFSAIQALQKFGDVPILIMHCTLCYPTAPIDANLLALDDLRVNFPNHLLGLSDHTLGTLIPSASVLLGVRAIEKHFTFDKNLPLSADHWLSLDIKEMAELVKNVRTLELSLGTGVKQLLECERLAHQNARRSIVAQKFIPKGKKLELDDLIMKRPGTGLQPAEMSKLLSKYSIRDIYPDELISLEDLDLGD
jgi:sialic acid synthase SpsE